MLKGLNLLLVKADDVINEWFEQGYGLVETTFKTGHNRVVVTASGTCLVYYYDTVVSGFDYELGCFFCDNRGFNTQSTSRIVNDMRTWCKTKPQLVETDVDTFIKWSGVECPVGEKL